MKCKYATTKQLHRTDWPPLLSLSVNMWSLSQLQGMNRSCLVFHHPSEPHVNKDSTVPARSGQTAERIRLSATPGFSSHIGDGRQGIYAAENDQSVSSVYQTFTKRRSSLSIYLVNNEILSWITHTRVLLKRLWLEGDDILFSLEHKCFMVEKGSYMRLSKRWQISVWLYWPFNDSREQIFIMRNWG